MRFTDRLGVWAWGVLGVMAAPAYGLPFNIGPVEGQFDSQFSLGTAWGMAARSQHLVGASNGGGAWAASTDDGRLNFKRGEAFTQQFSGTHALELRYQDSGLYVRGRYWYDFKLQDQQQAFKDIDDSGRAQASRSAGGQLLEAFAWHNYQFGGQPGAVRVGRQVVHWGEAQFIGGGIDAINPPGAALYPTAASQWRDEAMPTSLVYAQQGITDRLSVDGFYQLAWDAAGQRNCGTFFSSSDALAKGCDANLALGANGAQLDAQLAGAGLGAAQRQAALRLLGSSGAPDEGVVARRGSDQEARDGGQFGLAVHYHADPLATDFGAYWLNYHSRLPIFSGRAGGGQSLSSALASAGVPVSAALLEALQPSWLAGQASYYVRYPENIHLYGVSFSSTLPEGTRWRGELSYRPNAPVQVNWLQVLQASADGQADAGYRRKPLTQLQTSLEHTFDGGLGADQFTLAGEVGLTHVSGLGGQYYGRDAAFGPAPGQCQAGSRYCENDGFTTENAWGYRARAQWAFYNLLPRLELRPSLAWAHDVKGYAPDPGGNFQEGRKAVTVGLAADYQRTYSASLAYTNFFGGKYSTVNDRDFLSFTLGLQF
ncbi:DUF1302 domain-containing protein [Pseudomonas typographi]|uniref:DUF1302 domain-containing protein n=1 Tax=Pseudomonas typographi TaxID=2715964 RepID=UPI001EEF6458|nr:DUF1302 domain-containing protein [Pseudomonas typographi]